ncbi:adenine nucleotide alpha hydrolase family protein [Arabiibacter massiliensis]|uniref:electron transfer flavoprotein n=1 Tax=Arabiibacter massiliensis TaxID=1870985 RepID=UPI0009BAEF8F|nr:electron transfer flavoprotein [Arabiibacter massiliensis]
MNIVVCCKVVPDDQDIQVAGDRTLDYSKAKPVVSTYDLNALEDAAQLADGGRVVAVTAGPTSIDDSKLKKNVLARGVDELFMAADDACASMDARATAEALAGVLGRAGEYDLVLCGDGSADDYAQQVDVQLAARLGLPSVNGVVRIVPEGSSILVERALEDVVETVRVPLPAVVSVSPDIALPRIPGMKDILAAGKKPMDVAAAEAAPAASLETVSCLAPQQVDRKLEIMDAADDGAVEKFAAALKAAL